MTGRDPAREVRADGAGDHQEQVLVRRPDAEQRLAGELIRPV